MIYQKVIECVFFTNFPKALIIFAFIKKSISYEDISNFEELHTTEKPNKETTTESLKWVHITISNVMGNLLVNY